MFKKFSTSLSTIFMILAIGMAVLFGWSKTGWKALAVPTGSMEPSISTNSLTFVHHTDPKTLKVGDVITYVDPSHPGRTISHRIIKTSMLSGTVPQFVTKGDANKVPDIPVTSGSVVGKVVWHVPHVGAWTMGARTWTGIALVVYLPATILMIAEIRRLSAYWRLTMPKSYRLFGYRPKEKITSSLHVARYTAVGLAVAFVGASAAFAYPVSALLSSNIVALQPNTLTVAANPNPPPTSTCTNNNNVNVSSTSSQSASSGSANNSGNTNGGSATSGSASNSNSTNVNVSVNNGC